MAKAKFVVGDIVEYSNKNLGIPEGSQFKIIGNNYYYSGYWILEPENHNGHFMPYSTQYIDKSLPHIPESLRSGTLRDTRVRCITVPKRSKKISFPYMPYDPKQQEDSDNDI